MTSGKKNTPASRMKVSAQSQFTFSAVPITPSTVERFYTYVVRQPHQPTGQEI